MHTQTCLLFSWKLGTELKGPEVFWIRTCGSEGPGQPWAAPLHGGGRAWSVGLWTHGLWVGIAPSPALYFLKVVHGFLYAALKAL